jgi:hypothetical protein
VTGAMDHERLRNLLDTLDGPELQRLEQALDDDEQAAWLAEHGDDDPLLDRVLVCVAGAGFGLLLFAVALWVARKVVYG